MVLVIRLLLALVPPYFHVNLAHAQHDRTQNHSTAHPTNQVSVTASVCEARTINYITHSLPQLCLTHTWVSTRHSPDVTSTSSTAVSIPTVDTTSDAHDANSPTTAEEPSSHTVSASDAEPSETTFMSFEDWKEMMLRRTGQDPQELKSRKLKPSAVKERIPPDLGHFDLGEEDEISLDFDNYLQKTNQDNQPVASKAEDDDVAEYHPEETVVYEGDAASLYRSKDAGKTCKERFSYSSFDAGATVLKTGPGTKNAKAILVEHKDSYMLLECSRQSKYVIVELSDDILIDTVVLANFEFFSSMVRHFRVSVSDRYPVKIDRWRDIGTFEARNSRDIQPFLVENPQIWAKYVRIEFLTHYGNEYYCPLSLLRIHGSRMLDSWKDSETGREDEVHMIDEDEDEGQDGVKDVEQTTAPLAEVGSDERLDSEPGTPVAGAPQDATRTATDNEHGPETVPERLCGVCPANWYDPDTATCPSSPVIPSEVILSHDSCSDLLDDVPDTASTMSKLSTEADSLTTHTSSLSSGSDASPPASSTISNRSSRSTSEAQSATREVSTSAEQSSAGDAASETATSSTSSTKTTTSTSSAPKQRSGSGPGPSSAQPTVQEGFFNAITKRLHNVETNLTLSLQYLEEQSRHLQDAFHKAEQKQLLKVTNFLENLNQTVFTELHGMRVQYDQIWQSTVIALESQREQSERDIVALSTRLNLLADEVVFQKRMAIVQAILLLCCLFLVIFSRGVPIPYLAPLLEQNHQLGPYTTSPPAAPLKPYTLIKNGSLRDGDFPTFPEEDLPPRPPQTSSRHPPSQHASISDIGLGDRQAEPYHQSCLSPPSTPGAQTSDHIELDSMASGFDLPAPTSSTHSRNGGFQHSHCRKPLPALPEHPSPQS